MEVIDTIVSFSGIDSSGKTTQIELFYNYCCNNGIKVKKVWSKARGTPGVVWLKEVVRRDKHLDASEKLKYRNEIFKNSKKKKLLYVVSMLDLCWYWGIYYRILNIKYDILICDRYLWDTYVELNKDFEGINIDNSFLWKVVNTVAPIPQYSFIFVVSAEVSLERDYKKNAAGIEDIETKKKKIDMYMKLIAKKCWTNVMDGMKTIQELHENILYIIGLKNENR